MGTQEEKIRFMTMLPDTLTLLCSMQGAPHDDTILHRLLDLIKQLIISEDDADRSGLISFVSTFAQEVRCQCTSVLVLALGVAAHLVSMSTVSSDLWGRVVALFEVVQSSSLMEQSSVGAAYYNSLTTVADQAVGLAWLENHIIHLQSALITLQTAQSIFLLDSVENFIVTTIKNSLKAHNMKSTDTPTTSVMVTEAMGFLSNILEEMTRAHTSLLDHMIISAQVKTSHQSTVQIIVQLSGSKLFCEWKAQDKRLMTMLATLALEHTSEKIRFSALRCVVNLWACLNEEVREDFLAQKVMFPLLKLASDGEVERSLTVAAAFGNLSECPSKSDALSTMQKLHQIPYDIIFSEELHAAKLNSVVPVITTALCDRKRFNKLISSVVHFVKQTHNIKGLIRLLQSSCTTQEHGDWCVHLSSWPKGLGVVIMNNQRLLNSILHMLQQDDFFELSSEQSILVLKSLLQIMKRPLVESRLYSQSCEAFINILCKHRHNHPKGILWSSEIMSHLMELLKCRLVAVQWEVRDTTLEFIRNIITTLPDLGLWNLLMEHHVLSDAWYCIKDGESYPRASAITLATSLTKQPDWWANFLKDCNIKEVSLVDEMLDLLSRDTEAFPRRAAVHLLSAIFSLSSSLSPDGILQRHKICSALTSAMNDMDWEVKINALEFWEGMLATDTSTPESNSDLSPHDAGNFKRKCDEDCKKKWKVMADLLQCGFGRAVLAAVEDYDLSVKQKALRILSRVSDQLNPSQNSAAKLCRLDNKASIQDPYLRDLNQFSDKDAFDNIDQFFFKVSQMNPAQQLCHLEHGGDEYDRKPSSLLEDVAAAARMAATVSQVSLMSEDEFEEADDIFADCY